MVQIDEVKNPVPENEDEAVEMEIPEDARWYFEFVWTIYQNDEKAEPLCSIRAWYVCPMFDFKEDKPRYDAITALFGVTVEPICDRLRLEYPNAMEAAAGTYEQRVVTPPDYPNYELTDDAVLWEIIRHHDND